MRIIIEGDFFDCQVIRDRFFLWDTYGVLRVLDLRNTLKDISHKNGGNIVFTLHKEVGEKYVISTLRIKGGIYPLDSAYMGEHLYTATESGLFRRYLPEGEKIIDVSKGISKKLIDVRFIELSPQPNMMAMAGAEEGVFELYNPKKYRITKSGHEPKNQENGIYSVNRTFSKSVWYEKDNIANISNNGSFYLCHYRTNKQPDDQGRRLRTYLKQEALVDKLVLSLPAAVDVGKKETQKKETGGISRAIHIYAVENKEHQFSYGFATPFHPEPVIIASKPRRYLFGEFGTAAEAKKEVVVLSRKRGEIRINGPITRARVVSGFGGKNNLLITVCSDYVLITDFEE